MTREELLQILIEGIREGKAKASELGYKFIINNKDINFEYTIDDYSENIFSLRVDGVEFTLTNREKKFLYEEQLFVENQKQRKIEENLLKDLQLRNLLNRIY
jgi:hypothetical protein